MFLNSLRRECKVYPNILEEVKTFRIRVNNRLIELLMFPSDISNPTHTLFIEDNQIPLYRAGSYLRYGIYTKRIQEVPLIKSYFQKREKELQKILYDFKLNYIQKVV